MSKIHKSLSCYIEHQSVPIRGVQPAQVSELLRKAGDVQRSHKNDQRSKRKYYKQILQNNKDMGSFNMQSLGQFPSW